MSTATFAQLTASLLQYGRSIPHSRYSAFVHSGVWHGGILQLSTARLQEILIFRGYIYIFVPPRDSQRANAEQNRLRASRGVWGEEFTRGCCMLYLVINKQWFSVSVRIMNVSFGE